MKNANAVTANAELPPAVPWGRIGAFLVALLALFGAYRYYQHVTSFTVGLDYFEPEFQIYWMNLLYAQLAIEAVVFCAVIGYLWMTRDRNVMSITPQEELRRLASEPRHDR